MNSILSGGRNYASAIGDQSLSFSAKNTNLTQKLDFGEKIIICTRNCTLLTKGIVKSLENNWFNVCFSPRGRAGGIRARKWLFASKSQHFHQKCHLAEKYTFAQKPARGGSGVLYGPIWMQKAISRSGTGRGGLNHSGGTPSLARKILS